MSFPAQSFLYFIQVLTVSRGITPYYYKANSLVLLLYHLYLSLVIERFPIKPPFFAESGCKDKDFLPLLPNFSPSFFSKLPRSAASVPESGCKSTDLTFLKVFLYIFVKTLIFSGIKTADFKRQGKGEGQGTPYYIYKGDTGRTIRQEGPDDRETQIDWERRTSRPQRGTLAAQRGTLHPHKTVSSRWKVHAFTIPIRH